MSENSLTRFQNLLRTLFQFDSSDLDFGIYRILNYKRDQVEAFITERLPQIVDQAFSQYTEEARKEIEAERAKKRREVIESLGEHAFDESGNLKEIYREARVAKQYLELEEKARAIQVTEELKTRVYNDLYTFFSRYYEDGDFISKRRYGRQESYAIPYNGEEVVLYWANRDQYYVKTADRFKAYRFKVGDYSVAFELRNVAPENGSGGKKRYFVLASKDPIAWDGKAKTLTIAFEYRPLTKSEEEEALKKPEGEEKEALRKAEGQKAQNGLQDSLNEAAEKGILKGVADETLREALKGQGEDGSSPLRKHLTRFTRKNTADFFIHKGLRGFLLRELDFFLKNEVLLLDELIGGGGKNLWQLLSLARVERQVAEAIIEFLAQVEDFQKKLWEKRKFVLRTEYCLTIDRVPEKLWDDVLANEAQIAEWRQLYSLDVERTGDFLKAHPSLVVDTRHFPEDFKWRLLAYFDDLDSALDGLLIKSENWQALNLLLEKYRERINCVYIDPPYNSPATEILYKNDYKDSCWLTLICDRLLLSRRLLQPDAPYAIAIDDYEQHHLAELLDNVMPDYERYTIVVNHHPQGGMSHNVSRTHEYMLVLVPRGLDVLRGKQKTGEVEYRNFMLSGPGENKSRSGRPNSFYAVLIDPKTNRVVGAEPPPPLGQAYPTGKTDEGYERRYPISPSGEEKVWCRSYSSALELIAKGKIIVTDNGTLKIALDLKGRRHNLMSNWTDSRYNAGPHGTALLANIIGNREAFPYPKSIYTVIDAIEAMTWQTDCPVILDFFAGSGTTAHAVINLNREDGGKRKYILVEMGDWFETVLLPRIKKVVFCEKWKDGKPQGGQGTSHMLKYHYLEQYEDTLNNLELPREEDGQRAFEKFGDEYLLRYMLEFETQGSPSLLNLEMFKNPFAYELEVQEGDEIAKRRHPVDLVETFNYLLGIQVKKMRLFEEGGRSYRAVLGEKDGKRVVIVWRPLGKLEGDEEALMRDKAFIEEKVLHELLGEAKPDRLLVNGASFVKDAEAVEPEFHRLMFAMVGV